MTELKGERILLVDDDEILVERMAQAMEARGLTAAFATTAEDVPRVAAELKPTLAVLDLRLPTGSGLEILRDLREQFPDVRAVILTGYGSIATTVDAMRLGAVNYVQKPADADGILHAFARGTQAPLDRPDAEYEPPTLDRAEWEHIQRVLADCDGNISKAARKLGLHRRTLQRKLYKYPPRS